MELSPPHAATTASLGSPRQYTKSSAPLTLRDHAFTRFAATSKILASFFMALTLFGDPAKNDTVGWKSEPNERGTFTILWTCILTLFLCVWSALHLNIPVKTTFKYRMLRRTQWLFLALLAPELVAFTAYQQRREAYYTADVVRKAQGYPPLQSPLEQLIRFVLRRPTEDRSRESDEELTTLPKASGKRSVYPYTLVHGFYAVMGGFVVDTSDGEPWLPNGKDTATLSPCGVRIIARCAHRFLPNISKEHIQDKSKADPLVKTIVCLQATWFCIQCIGRFASGLPLSLLELNTLAHALCTLLIYLLWWDKPFDIEEPTAFGSPEAHPLLALLSFANGNVGPPWEKLNLAGRLSSTAYFKFHSASHHAGSAVTSASSTSEMEASIAPSTSIILGLNTTRRQVEFSDITTTPKAEKTAHGPVTMSISPREDRYWHLASQGYAAYLEFHFRIPILSWSSSGKSGWKSGFWISEEDKDAFVKASKDWPHLESVADDPLKSYIISFTAAGLFYGGLHALAWSAPFATPSQQLLWRLCSLSLGASGPVILIATAILYSDDKWDWIPKWEILDYTLTGLAGAFVLYYLFIRVFVVVESFLSLAHMSEGVYTCVEWSNYLPNFS